ncbi:hypothetical protein [Kribbella hippodromi]
MSFQQLPPPTGLPYPGPAPKLPSTQLHDPLAVAVGNASLLGLGYFLIRRWIFGALGLLGTIILIALLVTQRQTGYEFGLIAWGLLQVVHGWFLAYRQPLRKADLTKRLIALGVTAGVLGGFAFERYDTQRIDNQAVAARDAGNCDGVRAAQAKYNVGHRLGNAPRTVRVEGDVSACDRLDTAESKLRIATSTADVNALDEQFGVLSDVLNQPGQTQTVGKVVDGFVSELPTSDPCRTIELAGWLRARKPSGTVLDRATTVVPKIEPAALLGCADASAAKALWPDALRTYQLLLTRYPQAEQAARAKAGVQKANYEILQAQIRQELERVRELVRSGEYCSSPAKFSPAPRIRAGVNRAMFEGSSEYPAKLPSQWKGTTADNTALIVCVGSKGTGPAVRTCRYTPIVGGGSATNVTFHNITVGVKVYELRTGSLIRTGTIQITGTVCPATISYMTFKGVGAPDPDQDVRPTTATIQDAFRALVVR